MDLKSLEKRKEKQEQAYLRPDSDGIDSSMATIGCLGIAALGRRRTSRWGPVSRPPTSESRKAAAAAKDSARGIDSSGAPTFGFRLLASAISVTPWIILLVLTDVRAQVLGSQLPSAGLHVAHHLVG